MTTSDAPTAPEATAGTVAQVKAAPAIGGNVNTIWRNSWTWSPAFGTHNLQIPWNVINRESTVVVTASELDADGHRFVGGAPFSVSSIAPGPGVVTFKINIGIDRPLPMRTDVIVFN